MRSEPARTTFPGGREIAMGNRDVAMVDGTRMCHPVGVAEETWLRSDTRVSEKGSTKTDPHRPVMRSVAVSLVGPKRGAFLCIASEIVAQGTTTPRQEHRFTT